MPRLEIQIVEAQGLPAADMNGKADPFVEVCTSIDRQRTEVKKKTLSPVWRETKTVAIADPMRDAVGILVFDWDLVGTNDTMAYSFLTLMGLPPMGQPLDTWVDLYKATKKDVKKAKKKEVKKAKPPKPTVPAGRIHLIIRALDFQPPMPPMAAMPPMGPYPGQPPMPMPGGPMPGGPMPGGPMPCGPMPGGPMPGQPPMAPYPGQPMPGGPMPGGPMPGGPMPGQPPMAPYPGQPMPGQPPMAPYPQPMAPYPQPMPAGPAPGFRPLTVPIPYTGAIPIGFQNKCGHLRPKKTEAQAAADNAGKAAKKTLKAFGKIFS